jgi:hypothetical protein
LVASVAAIAAGVSALQHGDVDYFGITGFAGTQAKIFGWASLLLGTIILFIYFRGKKEP